MVGAACAVRCRDHRSSEQQRRTDRPGPQPPDASRAARPTRACRLRVNSTLSLVAVAVA